MCALLMVGAEAGIKDNKGYGCLRLKGRGRASRTRRAPADAACSETAEDVAKRVGKAAEYADGAKQVRAAAHPQAQAFVRVRRMCECGLCSKLGHFVRVPCVVCVCVCALARARVCV